MNRVPSTASRVIRSAHRRPAGCLKNPLTGSPLHGGDLVMAPFSPSRIPRLFRLLAACLLSS
eukprot:COSAG01_NODE_1289_length_10885_cov_3.769331_7_plen_62_part_00